jgi:PAS domain S-box-containing protein
LGYSGYFFCSSSQPSHKFCEQLRQMPPITLTDINLEAAIARYPLIIAPTAHVVEAIALMSAGGKICDFSCEVDSEVQVIMSHAQNSCVLVVEDNQLVGIVTERDLVRLSATAANLTDILIAEVMISPVLSLEITKFTNIFVALEIFQRHQIRHLPLVDEQGAVVGLLTHDSLRQLLRPVDLLHLRVASEVMTTEVIHAQPTATILELTQLMAEHRVSSVVIVETGKNGLIPRGIVTERDIVQFLALELDFTAIQAQVVMSTPVFALQGDMSLWSVRTLMQERQINRIVVTDAEGRLLGIVTQTSLLNVLNPTEIYRMVETLEEKVSRLEGEKLELLQARNVALETQVQERTAALKMQIQREKLLAKISIQLRSSFDVQEILKTTVTEVRGFLKCDRLLVYQFASDFSGIVVAESVGAGWAISINNHIEDSCFQERAAALYGAGRTIAINNIDEAGYTECHLQLLEQYQVKANLVVPILVSGQLWGLLIGHNCADYRIWNPDDLTLLDEIAVQLAIAIQQATAHQTAQAEIIERQKAELALKASEARLAEAQRVAQIGNWELEIATNKITWSAELFRILNRDPALGEPSYLENLHIYHPEDAEKLHAAITRSIFDGEPYQLILRICQPDGYFRFVEAIAQAEINPQGKTKRLFGTIQDITLRVQTETALAELNQKLELKVAERTAALQESQQFIEQIANASPNILYVYDIQEECNVYVNREISTVLGYSPQEIQAMKSDFFKNVIHPDDLLRVPAQYELYNTAQDGEILEFEYRMRHANGEWRWLYSRDLVFKRDKNGRVKQTIGTAEDITDRKLAETALKASEQRYLTLAAAAPVGIFRTDVQGYCLYVNERWCELAGISYESALGYGWETALHPEDRPMIAAKWYNCAQSGEMFCLEYRFQRPDGKTSWVFGQSVKEKDATGTVIGYVGTVTDINERKRLKKEQQRLIAILEASTDYIGISDAAGNVLWNNTEFKKLRGLVHDAPIQHHKIGDYHPQWAIEIVMQQGLPSAIANGTWMGETALLNLQGEEIPTSQLIIAHKSPQGEVEFLSTILRDMRIHKEYEQRLERSNAELTRATRLKDEFLANMSHELRTPLNAILGMSETLQEEIFGVLNERQQKLIATIESSGQHLLELINDILDVSKIEAGKLELHMTPVSVMQLCQSSLAFVKQQAIEKGIKLKSDLQPNLGDIIVDERRMRQVLINLLNNAVKFTPNGGQVMLRVYLEYLEVLPLDEDDSPTESEFLYSLCFSIIDTGIGIAPEDQDKLFQPFIQIDSSLNRKYAGTGLGLTLVKQIVELHGASITVTSELDQGSCFTVRLPYIRKQAVASILPSIATSPEEKSVILSANPLTNRPLILIAEDNQTNVDTIWDYLEACGYDLILATNGQEAIDMTITHSPHLILMDIQMPGIDGLEAMRQIRANPQLVSIPIIALTALAMSGDQEKCLQAGANEYLSKPIKLKQLVEMIKQML